MKEIIGAKIINVRPMTQDEKELEGWEDQTVAIELDNGIVLYPSQDEEGNGGGALFGREGKRTFYVMGV